MEGFKYCPKCKGNLKKEKFNMYLCSSCGFNWYINPVPCNGVILENKKGEILLIKRKWPPHKGSLDLPGGFIDLGEGFEESMKRELKEELDIDVPDLKFFKASDPDKYLFMGVTYNTMCFNFIGELGNKKPKALDDVGSIEYFPKDKIPYEKIAFKSLAKVLKEYIASNPELSS